VRHWVTEHFVNRDWWTAAEWEISRSPKLAAWVNPNAQCPVCGRPVYFFANSAGSRVFFDELGPPWPKHPCTDRGSHAPYQLSTPSPVLRSPAETRAYKEVARKSRIELPTRPNCVVLTTVSASSDTLVAVPMGLGDDHIEQYEITSASANNRPRKGNLLFRAGNEISFFHRPTLTTVSMSVKRKLSK
jgi:hypothetical protein